MKSRTAPDFWKLFRGLPPDIQRKAYKAYRLWRAHPFAGTLRFKRLVNVNRFTQYELDGGIGR